jgi:hypothetical protein
MLFPALFYYRRKRLSSEKYEIQEGIGCFRDLKQPIPFNSTFLALSFATFVFL